MRDLFTKGKGPYGKVYEKLRKRSLRTRNMMLRLNLTDLGKATFRMKHHAYVQGVRDALREVERGVS